MKQVTFLVGNKACGKTTLARKMAIGKNAIWLSDCTSPFSFSMVQPDTDLIVFDDCLNKTTIDKLKQLISSEAFKVERKGKTPFEMERPEIIICANSTELLEKSILKRIKVIDWTNKPGFIQLTE